MGLQHGTSPVKEGSNIQQIHTYKFTIASYNTASRNLSLIYIDQNMQRHIHEIIHRGIQAND